MRCGVARSTLQTSSDLGKNRKSTVIWNGVYFFETTNIDWAISKTPIFLYYFHYLKSTKQLFPGLFQRLTGQSLDFSQQDLRIGVQFGHRWAAAVYVHRILYIVPFQRVCWRNARPIGVASVRVVVGVRSGWTARQVFWERRPWTPRWIVNHWYG